MSQEIYTDLEFTPRCSGILANLHNWVYHFNPHTRQWNGIHRDNYMEYWNDHTLSIKADTVGEVQQKILDGHRV